MVHHVGYYINMVDYDGCYNMATVDYAGVALGKSHRDQHERTLMAALTTQPPFSILNYVQNLQKNLSPTLCAPKKISTL